MRILVTQRELQPPPLGHTYDALERVWYNLLHKHWLRPYPNVGVIEDDLDYDCLLLPGGTDSLARNATENLLIQHAIDHNKTIIGVCHGAFAINDYFGGTNSPIKGHEFTQHSVLMGSKEYTVNSFHGQYIETLANGFTETAIAHDQTVEAFEDPTRNCYACLWHPERMKTPILPPSISRILEV